MRRIVTGLIASALLSGTYALADNTNDYGIQPGPNDTFTTQDTHTQSVTPQQPGTLNNQGWNNNQQAGQASDRYSDTGMTSSTERHDVTRGYLNDTYVGIQPQVGVTAFTDAFGNTTSRGVVGLTMDANVLSMANRNIGQFFVGPQTGILYSHLGSPTANFVGTSPDVSVSDGANLLLIPVDLKLGYAIAPQFRISAHGGGNVIYRTVANSLDLGSSSINNGSSSSWNLFPNVGGDVEIGFGPNVGLMLRPDVTLTPGNSIFTGTVGLEIGLG